ncbi:hypothetical protein BTO18_07185 [Polaribacter porphyrae]|uniref:Tetracycline regulation of excision, RteC n=1 Tax=Polaribacter porphyrae TaxID=1137780 RepID=A0A2S7WTN7_9FLAO|nr:hypothetical protein BTO18_07185 [Polaribacter porphyrae]
MLKNCYKLIHKLEHNLKALESKIKNIHCVLEQSIIACKEALEKLREFVAKYYFNDKSEEIEFYKKVKPIVLSYLIFYVEQLHIVTRRTKEGKKEQIKYLKKFISNYQTYFHNNLEFYHYYKSNATHLDEQFFLRENKTISLNREAFHYFTEDQFSTSHDSLVATIMAYTKLIEYLKNEIAQLNTNSKNMEIINPFQKESELIWTGNNNELVELIYALYSSGRINNSNVDIKEITLAFEKLFKKDLGNYYQSFNDIRARKINTTKFLDTLKSSLVKYMQDLDE